MKKKVKKLKLAKETVRGLEKRDGLRHAAGGLLYADRQVTVETGCNFCTTDASDGSCCSCINSCAC